MLRLSRSLLMLALVTGVANAQGAFRPLTQNEKNLIQRAVTASLKDPSAAQFKWMPVRKTPRTDGTFITDYCGLLNGKNSYGGFVGFVPFYVQLRTTDAGSFDLADVRLIESPADNVSVIATQGACRQFGYVDFSLAR